MAPTPKENITYILQCSDNTLYTGWTNNLKKRLQAHNRGQASKYTRSRRPVTLVYAESHATKQEAMRREAQIKQLSRKQKEALIKSSQEQMAPHPCLENRHPGHKEIHHNKMAHAPSHHKQMEDLMRAEIPVPGIENWQLQRIDDAPDGIDNPSCQQPGKRLPGQGVDNLGKCQHTDPSHGNI